MMRESDGTVASQASPVQGAACPSTLQLETCKDPEGTMHIVKPFSFPTQHKATCQHCPIHQDAFSERGAGAESKTLQD